MWWAAGLIFKIKETVTNSQNESSPKHRIRFKYMDENGVSCN